MKRRMRHFVWLVFFITLAFPSAAQWNISVNITPVTCPGGNDGAANLSVSGNPGPYTFQWNDSAAQTTPAAVDLPADTFQVLITDSAGEDTLVTVIIPGPDPITFNPQVKPATCSASNGRITLNMNGGTPPYSYLWQGTNPSALFPNYLHSGSYHVAVTDMKGCSSDTAIIVPEGECVVKGELVFTPNGDGINDTWGINNINFYTNVKIVVYNRWGQVVHEQEGVYESWDGTHWGMPVPDATYYYVIYRDIDDKEDVLTGSVTIIR